MNSSGFFVNGATIQSIANKTSNFGYHRSTDASFSATVRTCRWHRLGMGRGRLATNQGSGSRCPGQRALEERAIHCLSPSIR